MVPVAWVLLTFLSPRLRLVGVWTFDRLAACFLRGGRVLGYRVVVGLLLLLPRRRRRRLRWVVSVLVWA